MSGTRMLVALFCIVAAPAAVAGPLDPPPGPIQSTMKPLDVVEPRIPLSQETTPGDATSVFKITQPGSYYLTGNLDGVAGKRGIHIEAYRVTVDLNGFAVQGAFGSLEGIYTPAVADVTVRNGHVRGWGGNGVDLGTSHGCVVENVSVQQSGGVGIHIGQNGAVRNCTVRASKGPGIWLRNGSLAESCVLRFNTGAGLWAEQGCTVARCVFTGNTENGLIAEKGCTIAECTAESSGFHGFSVATGSTVTSCTAVANKLSGFDVGEGCVVDRCTARENLGGGIRAFRGTSVTGCVSTSNTGDGIYARDHCRIAGNTCRGNKLSGSGGSGILIDGDKAVVEDNALHGNARWGVRVIGAGSVIIRNYAGSNTQGNFQVDANNGLGPTLLINQVLTNTNPMANVSQ